MTIYSFGHGVLAPELALPYVKSITTLIDIRSHPSSHWPQWRFENLPSWLPVRYEWWPALGGWSKEHAWLQERMEGKVNLSPYFANMFPKAYVARVRESQGKRLEWTSQGLYDYSWFTSLPGFKSWAERLIRRGKIENVAIMCCETLWWKCHRSMVADYVVFKGSDVVHMQPKPTLHSKAIGNRMERYDPRILKTWKKDDPEIRLYPERKPRKPPMPGRIARVTYE